MPEALFVTYGGAHVAMMIPVIRELRRRGRWDIQVLGLTTARAALDAAGIPSLGYRDLVRPGDRDALALGEELARIHHTEGVGIAREESVAYLGLCFADLQARVGLVEARRRVAEMGRRAFLPLGPLRRLMESRRPDIVVATHTPRSEEAAIRVARELGIPSVCMVPFAAPELMMNDTVTAHANEPGFSDRILVFSEPVRQWLIAKGWNPDHVVATGNPAFERLADPSLGRKGEEWRTERGLQGCRLILWASIPEPERPRLPAQILEALLEPLPRHPDWHVIYRRHPSEPFLPVPLPPRASHSDGRDDLPILLSAVDVVVTTASTVGMEAALMNRPLVKVCLSQYDAISPYERMGIALPVASLPEMEGRLEAALSDSPESRALAAARTRFPAVGQASARTADVLERLARH